MYPDRQDAGQLTVVIPTRNRSRYVEALLKFFRANGMTCRIIVADSSDDQEALAVDHVAGRIAEVHHYPADMPPIRKFLAALELVQTRYVVMLPDDDVTLPHAILSAVDFLEAHPDHVAAQGYVVDFGIVDNTFDMTGVRWFVPGVADDGPMARVYNLVRRYQPFMWAVFRRDALIAALTAAGVCKRIVFQELTTMVAAAIEGKTARLPNIYCLRGMEESLSMLQQVDPFYGIVADSDGFFTDYIAYRDNLAAFMRARDSKIDLLDKLDYFALPGASANAGITSAITLEHALNLIHALQFSEVFDKGMVNYTIQRMTGSGSAPIPVPPQWSGTSGPVEDGDVEHPGSADGRRYIWRQNVLQAEPRDEISITEAEIAIVEAQLEHYDS